MYFPAASHILGNLHMDAGVIHFLHAVGLLKALLLSPAYVVSLGCALLHLLGLAYRLPSRYLVLFPVFNIPVSALVLRCDKRYQ